MNEELDQMLTEVEMLPPSRADEMADFMRIVGDMPHKDYLEFMSRHNGGDGPVGKEGYVRFWPLDQVVAGTEEYGAPEFVPGLLLFGGDGGNEAFAFDRQNPKWPIVMVPMVGMSRKDMKFVAGTFTEFIQRLAADELPI